MALQITLWPLARQDLIDQYVFLEERSEGSADRFLEMFEETLKDLSQMPQMGSPQEFKNSKLAGIRKWRVRNFEKHLIFYRPLEDAIEIIRILYASRDIEALFEE